MGCTQGGIPDTGVSLHCLGNFCTHCPHNCLLCFQSAGDANQILTRHHALTVASILYATQATGCSFKVQQPIAGGPSRCPTSFAGCPTSLIEMAWMRAQTLQEGPNWE